MESAVATAESSPIVTEHKKPIQSAVETVARPSTVSESKEPTPSAVEDNDVTIVSKSKKTTPFAVETADNDDKTTPSAVETADNDDVTIISESKKPTTAQLAVETVENASIISESSSHEGHRLYHLVKLLEKFGKEAERAIHCLNGKLALSKKLVVRWAHAQIRAIEAKLQMMEENPDEEYQGPSAY
ncbi:unnamed protein product, partial [Coregonus sp. 'balchen']